MRCCRAVEIRHKCVDEVSLEGKEVKNTVVITFAFQVVFTAFNALQNLHSSLHDEESLGNISLAILYGTAILSSILSPTVIGLIGAKTVIVASFAAHCIYVLANFYPSFVTMAPAAVALGAFHGPAWTSQALYISSCAFSFSKSSSASPYSVLSRFNGFFFAVFATAQIVGNLVTSTIIRDGVGNETDDVLKFCGPEDCPHFENATIEDPEEWVLDITLGFLLACTLLGLFLVIFLLSPLPRSDWIQRVSVRETATSCFRVLVSLKMMLLVPLIFFTAAEHAFLMSAYTKSYVACPIGIHMIGYVMAVYGATTPAFVYIFSHLARITGRFLLLMLSLCTHIFLFIVLFRWTPTEGDKAVIFIIPIVWGVSESILQAQANALIAMLFPSQKEPAFANFHAWRSLGYAITFLNASYLCVSTKLIVCMTFAAVGTVLYVVLEFRAKIKQALYFKRARHSIISIPPEEENKPNNSPRITSSFSGADLPSIESMQNRLSFHRVEFTDIINEAQQGWRRDETGLTLEINKVMSLEHLAGSKATNWYHTGPVMYGYMDNVKNPGVIHSQSSLPHSMSDGELVYAAAKANSELQKNRNAGKKRNKSDSSSSKMRHSESLPRSFDTISEVSYEDEQGNNVDAHPISNVDNVVRFSNSGDDDVDEKETLEFTEHTGGLQLVNEASGINSLILNDNEIESENGDSSSLGGVENPAFVYGDNDLCDDGDLVFTSGLTDPSIEGKSHSVSESDDSKVPNYGAEMESVDKNGNNRLLSEDQGYLSEYGSDITASPTNNTSKPFQNTADAAASKDAKKNGKDKKFRVFKGFRKPKKAKNNETCNSKNPSPDDITPDNGDNKIVDENHSDADSDGFVDEFEDNKSYTAVEVIDTEKTKKRSIIPINEVEDVTCIF